MSVPPAGQLVEPCGAGGVPAFLALEHLTDLGLTSGHQFAQQ